MKKSIETCKSYIYIPDESAELTKGTYVWNMQPFLHPRAAGCLKTAYIYLICIRTFF